jgi:hypothetical protein
MNPGVQNGHAPHASLAPLHDDHGIGVARAETLLSRHLNRAVARFGPHALSVVDLPDLSTGTDQEPAQIQAAAALFWAWEIDRSGLLAFADALAQGVVYGTLFLRIGEGGARLMRYWSERHERLSAEEREAIYRRTFGDLMPKLDALAEAISDVGRLAQNESPSALIARANALSADVGRTLSERAVGITAFAARGIVGQIRAAMRLLHDPDIARALGGMDVWQTIQAMAPVVLRRAADPHPHIERARAGLTLLEWLAGGAPLGRDSPVIQAAEVWRLYESVA